MFYIPAIIVRNQIYACHQIIESFGWSTASIGCSINLCIQSNSSSCNYQCCMQHCIVGCTQIGGSIGCSFYICIQSVLGSHNYCNNTQTMHAKLILSFGCRQIVASVGCSLIICIQSNWSPYNYCKKKAKINKGVYVFKLNGGFEFIQIVA